MKYLIRYYKTTRPFHFYEEEHEIEDPTNELGDVIDSLLGMDPNNVIQKIVKL